MDAVCNFQVTPTGRRKRPTITQACEWVKRSWNAVKEEVVVKSFLKCGISNALDGTEDDFLFEEYLADPDDPDPIAENSSDEESNMDASSENEFSGFEEEFSGFED